MKAQVSRTLSFVVLSCRYFDLNQGAKVGAMPEHSDYFCNEELGQKTNTWSSRPGEFHPEPLTEPYVKVSLHTALHCLF